MAALINMMANRLEYQIQLEKIATMDFFDSLSARADALSFQVNAWRSERRAAALFAEFDVLQNRLRPYAPLDVHIPEWIEPEIVGSIGTGVMSNIIEQANSNGAFMLNAGYYHSYKAEVAALDNDRDAVMREGAAALNQLPAAEVLLRARLAAQMGKVAWRNNDYSQALTLFENAYLQDPSILRRLAISLPVDITNDGTVFSQQVADYLADSPRFSQNANGMNLEVSTAPDLTVCLKTRTGTILSCYTIAAAESESSKWNAQQLTQMFHTQTFGLGFEISQAQRSILMGSSVILSSQNDRSLQRNREAVLDR